MRLLAIVSDEHTYQPLVYEPLLRELHSDFVGLVLVPFRNHKTPGAPTLRFLYDLYGPGGFCTKALQVVRSRLLNAAGAVIPFEKCYSLSRLADKYNVPLHRADNVNAPELIELAESLAPDLILSSQSQYVGRRLQAVPRIGVINKHAGLLPRYRGLYPVFWAMLNDEREIGVTVHFMNDKIDGGDILAQATIPIGADDTFESLYRKVVGLTPILFIRVIRGLADGSITPRENPADLATCYSTPSHDDIARFKRAGKRVI